MTTGYAGDNAAFWDGLTGAEGEHGRQHEYGRAMWAAEPNWGDWSVPESEVRLLPDVTGKDVVELGCGTAYFSGWLARRGTRPVAVDASRRQLDLARALQSEFGVDFPLLHADAEQVPRPDASFDLALSEYGASSWCDPDRWLPEAARLLRPGGLLTFLIVSPFLTVCTPDDGGPAGDRLLHDYFGMHRLRMAEWGTTEFQLTYGGWVRALRHSGFAVEGLTELQPPQGARTPWPFVDRDWAARWPSECVWTARKAEPPARDGERLASADH